MHPFPMPLVILFLYQMLAQIGKIFSKINDRYILFRYIHPFVRQNKGRKITSENTLCLFCQPRGGSTWLSEILLNIPGSVLIDEPLWRGRMSAPFKMPNPLDRKAEAIADLDFYFHQPIPDDVTWSEAKEAFEEILSGRTVSIGMYDEQDLSKLSKGNYHIVKFNYANLLAPWLSQQFDFKAIALTRHPCAVVASQLQLPAWKNINVTEYVTPNEIRYNHTFEEALSKIGSIDSKETFLTMIWAIGFKNTILHPNNGNRWLPISYEGLLQNFGEEINRINEYLNTTLDAKTIDHGRPSKSTRPGSLPYLEGNTQLGSWKDTLSNTQIKSIMKVLDQFEIDIYSEDLEPDYDRLYTTSAQT